MDEMTDFANDIAKLQSFVGQPYNNSDQQDAEIRLFTELMAMIVKVGATQDLPNHTAEIFGIEQRLDNVSKKVVALQEGAMGRNSALDRLSNSITKLSNDVEALAKKVDATIADAKTIKAELGKKSVVNTKLIKDAVEKEVAKVFETE